MPSAIHLVTGEYPPKSGGVADYTRLVAQEIARRGIDCHVWTRGESADDLDAVPLHRVGERLVGEALAQLRAGLLSIPDDARIVVQYVPHAFGEKGMNLAFVRAIDEVARGRRVDLMFHEVAYPWVRRPLKHNLLAAVNRWMVRRLCRHASRAYVSIPAWTPMVRRLAPSRMPMEWAPVPSNIPASAPESRDQARARYGLPSSGVVVGHFGTYGGPIATRLDAMLERVALARPDICFLLIGRGSLEWLAARRESPWARRATATGELSQEATGATLQACDLMVQPYPDGVSTRRGTVMACLANGRPVVTTIGALSEPFWNHQSAPIARQESSQGSLGDVVCDLAANEKAMLRLGTNAAKFYEAHFAIDRTVDRLLGTSPPLNPDTL